jgi:putative cardiolipin synthase
MKDSSEAIVQARLTDRPERIRHASGSSAGSEAPPPGRRWFSSRQDYGPSASSSGMPEPDGDERSGNSGLRLLQSAKEAFAARLALIRSARQTLDIQYYIWHNDLSGSLILEQIAIAAARGVKVRLLLDDNGINGLDARLIMLNESPNIEVRLFNPFTFRRFRAINWLFAFKRLNVRMHAKSLTADGRATIVGGRNIGDEYFGAQSEGQFEDLDVLAVGPAAAHVEQVFEDHWQCREARPIETVVGSVSRRTRRRAMRYRDAAIRRETARNYLEAIEALPFFKAMQDGPEDLVWAPTRVVATMPRPGAGRAAAPVGLEELVPPGLAEPAREFILVSGYFVPTVAGCNQLADLRRRGPRVRVLTNSFGATDVGVVHAGYAPYRRALLERDIELFEMPAPDDAPKTRNKFVRSGSAYARKHSGKSLHAKAYIVDRTQLYIGSANFDPRSARINTELGVLIESPPLAERLANAFEIASQNSYRLGLAPDGNLLWIDERDDEPEAESCEPGTNVLTRIMIRLLARLPIEHQL